MEVFGKERHFLLTVGAATEIASFCPNGDLSRIVELMNDSYDKSMIYIAKLIVALNKGYEQRQKFETGESNEPLTLEMVMALDMQDIAVLQREALNAFTRDSKTTVKTQSKKKTD